MYNTGCSLLYTFYHTFYLTKGEEILLTSSSEIDHIIDMFFYGHPKKPIVLHSPGMSPDDLTSGESIIDSIRVPNPLTEKDLIRYYTPALSEEMQGLNWKFISEKSLSSNEQVISKHVKIPMTGYYNIRITSIVNLTAGVANFNMNGKYIYEGVPINYFGIDYSFPANKQQYTVMTLSQNNRIDDPIIFVHGADADRVVAYNDDVNNTNREKYELTEWDALLSESYLFKTSSISISSYNSLTPISTCQLIFGQQVNPSKKIPTKNILGFTNKYQKMIELTGELTLDGEIIINSTQSILKVSAFSLEGSMLNTISIYNTSVIIPVETLGIAQKGFYIIRIETEHECLSAKVLIK